MAVGVVSMVVEVVALYMSSVIFMLVLVSEHAGVSSMLVYVSV